MTHPALPGIRRHFCTLGRGQVHYVRAGHGPAVVLLHRAPRSGADMAGLVRRLAPVATVIAPDLPGYGASTPLTDPAPGLDAYAGAVAAFLEGLGIQRAVVLGEREGAAVALALAAARPDLVAGMVAVGLPDRDAADHAALLACLPDLAPHWDGSHLTRLWSYLREEAHFEPFHAPSLENRRLAPFPTTDDLQARAVQLLSAAGLGEGFGRLIQAVGPEVGRLAERLAMPALFTGGRDRQEHRFAAALAGRTTANRPRAIPTETAEEAERLALDQIRASLSGLPPAPDARATAPVPGALWSDYVDVPGGQLHLHRNHDADTLPLLIQHDAASSTGTVEPITRSLVGRRSVMALDLPGSGLSDNTIGEDTAAEVGAYADAVRDALDGLGLPQVDFYGMWGGGFVGLELAHRTRARVRRLVMSNAFFHDGEELAAVQACYTPDVSPVWHGGHLMQCWHQMRDQGLFYPWFDRSAAGVLRREPFVAAAMAHQRVCALMQAGNMYRTAYQAHFVYPTRARLSAAPVPTLLASTAWDPNRRHTDALVRSTPACRYQELDGDFTRWGLSFLWFLEEADKAASHAPG